MASELIYILIWFLFGPNTTRDETSSTASNIRLGYVEGVVGNGNFTYFYIYHKGGIILSLKSREGDADLYVSTINMFPSYDLDSYDLHSATCGQELIEITDEIKSPLAVGVYGYSTFNVSSFVLEILPSNTKSDPYFVIDDYAPEHLVFEAESTEENKVKAPQKVKLKKRNQNISNKVTGIFSLFEIIQLIFL